MKIDLDKEYICGESVITRNDYESMAIPIDTSSLTDDDMEQLAERIEYEMKEWQEWRDNGDISEDKYQEHWWDIMEEYGINFGMKYYEDKA